jgi:hypothetical protein
MVQQDKPLPDTCSWWGAAGSGQNSPRRSQAAGGPLAVSEAMKLLTGMKRQNRQKASFDQLTLGLNIYPPDI